MDFERTTRPEPKIDWFIPIDGDGNKIGTVQAERLPTFQYLKTVAQTADRNGFHSLLVPTRFSNGLFEEGQPLAETWTTVTALCTVTQNIRFLIAVRPGFISTGLFARMVGTLDEISNGRIDLNIVPGGISGDLEKLGENSSHGSRYERAAEFIEACKLLWSSPKPVDFDGTFINLRSATCSPTPSKNLKFYIGGASDKAIQLTAKHGDNYLAWILPTSRLGELLKKVQKEHHLVNRTPSIGMRTHIIARKSETEAWKAAETLLDSRSQTVVSQRNAVFSKNTMEGQKYQIEMHKNHIVDDNLWNGISTVRVNCGTAIVGNYDQVTSKLYDYWKLGIDEFILSGYPHVEECNRIAEEIIPVFKNKLVQE